MKFIFRRGSTLFFRSLGPRPVLYALHLPENISTVLDSYDPVEQLVRGGKVNIRDERPENWQNSRVFGKWLPVIKQYRFKGTGNFIEQV